MRYAWDKLDEKEIEKISEEYKKFLSENKTEYETAEYLIEKAKENGFENLEEKEKISPGDKIYWIFNEKLVLMAKIGNNIDSFRIIGSHIDSPHIEVKIKPVENKKDINLGVLKISYYGGFYPYLWLNRPLEMRGIVYKGGEKKKFRIGGLVISDNLPHLSRKRMEERKAGEVVRWEELKIISTNKKKGEDGFGDLIYDIISEKVGFDFNENDFIRASIQIVPENGPVDVGMDKSMIGGYGHDDRVSVFTSLKAVLEYDNEDVTGIGLFVDKEEIGSESNTSARSEAIKYFFEKLLEKSTSSTSLREVMLRSKGISADVTAGVSPGFEDAYDVENSAVIGGGLSVERFLDYNGRYMQNEASIKFVDWFVGILEKRNIPWQATTTFSKTDPKLGGGGTISAYMARTGMEVIDSGIPVIGMHSPFEIISKADLYAAYLGYKAFLEEK